MAGRDRDERRAFREFVRAHHPDVGGDPEVFRAGLEALRAGRRPAPSGESAAPVEVHHRRRGPGVLLDWLQARRARRRRAPRVR